MLLSRGEYATTQRSRPSSDAVLSLHSGRKAPGVVEQELDANAVDGIGKAASTGVAKC
jgi:hypothetical protein